MKPHRRRHKSSAGSARSESAPVAVPVSAVHPPGVRGAEAPDEGSALDAEATISQLEEVVSEFMIQYPSHTQRIPSIRPGEQPLIAFVRAMAASMASKQEQLEKLNAEIVEAAEEKERFLANMSHEVRTPMNGIFGLVNLLLDMELEPVQRDYLETIHASSESLLNILDDVLDYSKLNAKEVKLRPRPFDLSKLLRDVLLVYQPAAEKKQVELSATICDSLPDRFLADDLRLKQVLSNLVSNAIKFTSEGQVSVTVQPFAKSGREQLLFAIHDTGVGISPEAGKDLFSPFHQIETTESAPREGTGLGLAISKNLVELMGGRVWFESEEGAGSTFFFAVDYALPESEPDPASDMVSRGKIPSDRGTENERGRIHVLLVEDNKINQRVATLILQRFGCEVTIAGNGQEAIDLADGPIRFELICMDVNMPVMNGLEASRRIRELDHENQDSYIVAMTGLAFSEDRENCLEAGMNEVITKPFQLEEIQSVVERVRRGIGSDVALSS